MVRSCDSSETMSGSYIYGPLIIVRQQILDYLKSKVSNNHFRYGKKKEESLFIG